MSGRKYNKKGGSAVAKASKANSKQSQVQRQQQSSSSASSSSTAKRERSGAQAQAHRSGATKKTLGNDKKTRKNVNQDEDEDEEDDDEDMLDDDDDDDDGDDDVDEDDANDADAEIEGDDDDDDDDENDDDDDEALIGALTLFDDEDDDDDDANANNADNNSSKNNSVVNNNNSSSNNNDDNSPVIIAADDADDVADAFRELTPAQLAAQLRQDALDPRIRYLSKGPADDDKPPLYGPEAAFYESESDEELDGDTNTVGNVPMEWYRHYDHIGYNVFGQRLMKAEEGDRLDRFLSRADDPAYWRTVRDELNARDVTISERELDLIRAMQRNRFPTGYDPYEWPEEHDDPELKIHGLSGGRVEPKRRFIPSKWERLKIRKIVNAMRRGHIPRDDADPTPKPVYYDLWKPNEDEEKKRRAPHLHLKAPNMRLPGHAESYRPPEEYLFSAEELRRWEELDEEDRNISFVPQRLDRMRQIPLFAQGLRERFERCLDLYLCPRVARKRSHRHSTPLLPKLPKPADLRPFPTAVGVTYEGHTARVRSISPHAAGQWLATASDDRSVRIWEVLTGRCLKVLMYPDVVTQVSWCPNESLSLLAVVCDEELYFVNAGVGTAKHHAATELLLALPPNGAPASAVKWKATGAELHGGLHVVHPHAVKHVAWHHKGDYCATVTPNAGALAVLVHQLSTLKSQAPFRKSHGRVECVSFHPNKPLFIVATQTQLRVYNLVAQKLFKKLQPNVKYISSVDVHPGGDNLIVTSYDRRLCWFDLELSTQPYKTLRYHTHAIRRGRYHPRFPLFASASDDTTVHVFHGMVYDDWNQDALIVPLKVLRGHKTSVDGLGVLDIEWHPKQPWLFSSGGDKTVKLWS